MIQIARSIRLVTPVKIEEAVEMASSAIFDEKNPRDTILEGEILAKKIG